VAKEFKIVYQKQTGSSPGNYTMDHSAGTYIFDPQGRLRLFVGLAQGPDVFTHDLREILNAG
jgi:protein SCO1/2